jgi:hypothetical protein
VIPQQDQAKNPNSLLTEPVLNSSASSVTTWLRTSPSLIACAVIGRFIFPAVDMINQVIDIIKDHLNNKRWREEAL